MKNVAKQNATKCRMIPWLFAAGLLVVAGSGEAYSQQGKGSTSKFVICSGQTYALCAAANCFVMDGVGYCQCQIQSGDSISLSYNYGTDQNVCSLNAAGAENGYMVSTFSVPDSIVAPDGDQALYTCPATTSNGAYAQCDGGLCFTSTEGELPPGSNLPLTDNEIICACPITVANPRTAHLGYQIVGPYPCQQSFFQNCNRATANTKTGSQIFVGAPTGTGRLLARMLNGSVPPLNECLR